MRNKKLFLLTAAMLMSGCSATPSIEPIDTNVTITDSSTSEGSSDNTEATIEAPSETIIITEGETVITPSTDIATTKATDDETTTAETTTVEATTTEATTTEATTTEATTEATTESTTAETTVSEPNTEDSTTAEETPAVIESTEAIITTEMYVNTVTNVRTQPSTDADIYCKLESGTPVSVISITDGWASVIIDSKICYIFAELLTEENETSTEESTSESISESSEAPETTPEETTASPETTTQSTSDSIVVTNVSYCGVLYTQGSGPCVCIDPGHMGHGSPALEPNAPGSTEMKARATTGTAGVATGNHESLINLIVSIQLRDELLKRGYNVMMTRESQDVDISNMERALMANNDGADILVRVHCNSVVDPSVNGIVTMSPSAANPYVGNIYNQCYTLSDIVLKSMLATTGAKDMGVYITDTMSGINWSLIPVTIVEMGFMSNPTEDQLLADTNYQYKLVQGMANGIDAYFGR